MHEPRMLFPPHITKWLILTLYATLTSPLAVIEAAGINTVRSLSPRVC